MATQDEGQENRRNASRPGSAATGGRDTSAAAATTNPCDGTGLQHINVVIKTKKRIDDLEHE
jgi:hypothetical protein